jgi:hypothetical protein
MRATQLILFLVITCLISSTLHAGQSIITEGEGYACMGDDKSRKVTETTAVADAKRKATESAATYIKSETHIKDALLEKDLLSAYTNAQVKILQELMKEWYKEQNLGDCYRVKLKVEVLPDEKTMAGNSKKHLEAMDSDPSGPLAMKVWTDKKNYSHGQKIRIYVKGNKPFYGRVVYKDAEGKLVQLLPNPYRTENYFNGGVIYELPGNGDRFDLEVTPPFGNEVVTVYGSTSPLGEIETTTAGGVFGIMTKSADVATNTRGVKVKSNASGAAAYPSAAEFAEVAVDVITGGK